MDTLPNELLDTILCGHLSCAWATIASLTCRRWSAVVALSTRRQSCARLRHGSHVALLAAEGASLSLLGWLKTQGARLLTYEVAVAMAGTDNLDGLLWLRSLGCPVDRRTVCQSRRTADFDFCLDAACGCDAIAQTAVKHGALSVLRWAITEGGWADSRLVAAAIRSGNVCAFDSVFAATGPSCEWVVAVACQEAAMCGNAAMIDRLCDVGQFPCVYPEDMASLFDLSVEPAIMQRLVRYKGGRIMWTVD
ncbi:hypothetical protein psal_cds_1365 [Pandoravirus salinus]|uniref:F-box incomplete domain containing protein n=1 Tax=Pandoravirus salinus TaxID=1349410 RepID=S4W1S9_9VIRU|nr:hypothetical protein psal_cds_1365 [Pandoravirus salinus]AGO85766.1 hypothetical protein psal_cds_1365 [Pandoravirus salinus]